ncbi:MAG: hypothetical protein WCP21_16205, partial [Armatimonadota bacterium]
MRTRQNQQGATLIMVIGIIAALAIMASALVVLVTNVSGNTARDRTTTKAFDVSEGALDFGMNTLAASWPRPTTAIPSPATPVFSLSAFKAVGQFGSSSEYPAPNASLGQPFASVTYYDNTGTTPDNINYGSHIDANQDNKMWVVASGATGSRMAIVHAEVNRNFYNTNFPTGIAVYTGGNLTSNGGGNNPKITIEDQTGVSSVTGIVAGNLQAPSVFQSTITPVVGNGDTTKVPSLE